MTGAPRTFRIAVYVFAGLVLAFLMLPILAVIPASINETSFIYLPPKSVSWRWYDAFLADREWRTALANSTKVALSTMAIAVGLGTLAALGLQRLGRRWRTLLNGLFLAPLIVPVIVTAVALYRTIIDLQLTGSMAALIVGHVTLALPFVVINVGISLRAVDPNWLRAAEGLGAGPWTAFRTVTLPNILPGLIGGGVFAFLTSFDEVVVSVFLAGYRTKTLPVKMWETIRLEFTPVVAVAATVMIVLAVALFLGARLLPTPNKAATT